MDKSLLVGLVAGAGAATAVAAVAHFERGGTPAAATLAAPAVVAEAPAAPVAPPVAAPRVVERTPAPVRTVHRQAAYAEVVDVQPVTRTVREPREVCEDVPVQRRKPVRDEHQVAGTVLGAAIGGVIGNQVGDGRGRTVAKVAGVLAGGYAGNKVQERVQESNVETVMERRCETVYDERAQRDGYDVTYEYGGRTTTVRMPHDPGSRLPVRDGRVLTTVRSG
jgi:uncharacterized protein YcfJ